MRCSPPSANLGDQLRHLVQLAWTYDQIDVRGPPENQSLIFLSHAAQHADDLVRMMLLGVLEPAQGAVDLVFGMLPDTAGIEQDRIGVARVVGQLVAVFAQAGHDKLAVEHVHLAADGFDVEFLGHSCRGNDSRG